VSISLERGISLAFHESGLPWHALRVLRQLWIVLAMGRAIERHTLELAIRMTFIGVEESESRNVSDKTIHACIRDDYR
jgi:hypothetical protein